MTQLGRAATSDDVLIWEHGRRFGIVGDGQAGDPSLLMLDGKAHLSNRQAAPFFTTVSVGAAAAGPVTIANAVKGDTVVSVTRIDASQADASASFEATVSATGQVQQTSASNLSAQTFLFIVYPRS